MRYLLYLFIVLFTSFFVTRFVLQPLYSIASKIDLYDYPNKRKIHKSPTPLMGGLGMFAGLFVSSLAFIPISNLTGFYIGVVLLVLIGFMDDLKGLGHRSKFLSQILAALFVIYLSNSRLLTFGDLIATGNIDLGILSIPLTIFCIVGVINSINMIDGLDGLAGGIAFIAFITFAALSFINGQPELMLLSIALSGACLAFLKKNWHPASLYMGDAGSLLLGFSLAFLSIAITQKEGGIVRPVVPLLILSVPIVDTVTIMTRRALNGKNPFLADKFHLHHILLKYGMDKTTAVKFILTLTALFSFVAVAGTFYRVQDYYLFLICIIYFAIVLINSFFIKNMVRLKMKRRLALKIKSEGI